MGGPRFWLNNYTYVCYNENYDLPPNVVNEFCSNSVASSLGLPLYPPYYNVEKIMRGKFMQS